MLIHRAVDSLSISFYRWHKNVLFPSCFFVFTLVFIKFSTPLHFVTPFEFVFFSTWRPQVHITPSTFPFTKSVTYITMTIPFWSTSSTMLLPVGCMVRNPSWAEVCLHQSSSQSPTNKLLVHSTFLVVVLLTWLFVVLAFMSAAILFGVAKDHVVVGERNSL